MSHYAFLDKYIGLPYAHQPEDDDSVNCYSLIRRVFKEVRNIDLPDWTLDDSDIRTVIKTLKHHIREEIKNRHAIPVLNGDRRDWDLVIVERNGGAHHMGLYIGGGVLHADEGYGSRWEPTYQFEYTYKGSRLSWWRWPIERNLTGVRS